MFKRSKNRTQTHDIFDYLALLDCLEQAPYHGTQLDLMVQFGKGVYTIAHNHNYFGYDKESQSWIVLPEGQQFRQAMHQKIKDYYDSHLSR